MDDRRVWITGVGAATPLGSDFATIRQRLMGGESAARVVVDRTAGAESESPGCLIGEIPVPAGWDVAKFRQFMPVEQATMWTSSAALADAGLRSSVGSLRVGLILGAGAEWLRYWETSATQDDAAPGGTPLFNGREPENLAARVARQLGLRGPHNTVAAACASANYALALGRQWIKRGLVDICLAGGAEIASAAGRAAFQNLRAMSRRVDAPRQASRPFDRDRDGFVMGEGAVMFVLEADDMARRRGARAYGEIAGFGASSDAFHLVLPSNDPEPMCNAMRAALADAELESHELDYVNAHAPGTPAGDRAEARALRQVLGDAVTQVPVSSTKSITGHLLSAAAAMETLASVVAIASQAIPPTINLDHPDPECELHHVAHYARDAAVDVVLSNSFGFGGNNTSLVLRRAA